MKLRQFAITSAGSVKVKLLLCCFCMLFTLIVLASHVPSVMGWNHRTAPPPHRLTGPRCFLPGLPASITEYVTKNRNCEDNVMSFLVANSGAPPVPLYGSKGKIFEIGSTGIGSLGGHTETRTHYVNRFVSEYGRMPLISTSVKAVDSRNIWF